MTQSFINNNKLAMLDELQYLLFELLGPAKPIPFNELGRICKQRSLNFTYAFENTISFLERISVIKINADKFVTRSSDENFEALKSDLDLNVFIIKKTLAYLAENNLSAQLINNTTIKNSSGRLTVYTSNVPPGFSFIRVFLLNLYIAEPDRNANELFIIAQPYRKIFEDELLKKHTVVPPLPPDIKETEPIPEIEKILTTDETTIVKSDPVKKKPTFFISYASEDETYKNELQNHLSGLVHNNLIESWDGRVILPGADWDDEVRKKLDEAKVVLFLLSSSFMASGYIRDVEIKRTIERHKNKEVRIIPVMVRPCDYPSLDIGKYQLLPTGAIAISLWQNKDEAYLNVVNNIKKILDKI